MRPACPPFHSLKQSGCLWSISLHLCLDICFQYETPQHPMNPLCVNHQCRHWSQPPCLALYWAPGHKVQDTPRSESPVLQGKVAFLQTDFYQALCARQCAWLWGQSSEQAGKQALLSWTPTRSSTRRVEAAPGDVKAGACWSEAMIGSVRLGMVRGKPGGQPAEVPKSMHSKLSKTHRLERTSATVAISHCLLLYQMSPPSPIPALGSQAHCPSST